MLARKPLLRIVSVVLVLPIAALYILSAAARQPKNLGVRNGRLTPCPDKPNCVSTQAERDEQRIEPLPLRQKPSEAMRELREMIQGMPRSKIVSEEADYLHAEFTSLLFRFVDDLELWIDEANQLIHARSASRVGYSDLGSNRKRVESLFRQYRQRHPDAIGKPPEEAH